MHQKNEFRTEFLKSKADIIPEKGHLCSSNEENGMCKTIGCKGICKVWETANIIDVNTLLINYQD